MDEANDNLRPTVRGTTNRRRAETVVLTAAGLAAYNWWIALWVVPRGGPSLRALYSDLAAQGRPGATALQRLDLAAGLLLLGAVVLARPAIVRNGGRALAAALATFAVAVALGGVFPFACPPSLDAACQAAERSGTLPLSHYLHMLAGVAEFASASAAVVLATRARGERTRRIARPLVPILLVAFPLLGAAYLLDRGGVLVEPVFLVSFSAIVATVLTDPVRPDLILPSTDRPSRQRRGTP